MSTYPDDCPVAATLDAVGDRWTLLIVRDLLRGITRYGDLRARSSRSRPTCSPAACAGSRISASSRASATASARCARAIALTERGRALAPVIVTLGRFGIDHLGRAEPDYLAAHVGCGGRVPPTAWRCLRCGDDVTAGELELLPPAESRAVAACRRSDWRCDRP